MLISTNICRFDLLSAGNRLRYVAHVHACHTVLSKEYILRYVAHVHACLSYYFPGLEIGIADLLNWTFFFFLLNKRSKKAWTGTQMFANNRLASATNGSGKEVNPSS